jgi:molybdopterin-guanine dinucleotide biosynthesis protein A
LPVVDANAVTGVILAGGRAERLGGIAKGMLERDGRPLVARIAAALAEVAGARLLVADDPTPYAALGLPSIPDAIRGVGPAGGLLAALEHVTTPWVLVVACDMPGVAAPLLALLRDREERYDVVVPVVGGLPEPLCARWATRVAPVIREEVRQGRRKMSTLLEPLVVERLSEAILRMVDPGLELTGNVNTPADAERLGLVLGR